MPERIAGRSVGKPLPAGDHGLSSGLVTVHQRRRILDAVAIALGRVGGYDQLAVRHVIEIAGVSRLTFYVHFDNRLEVFRAAYDEAFGRLLVAIGRACEAEASWPAQVAMAITATLGFARDEPLVARLVALEAVAAGSAMAAHHYASLDRLVPELRRGRELRPHGSSLPSTTEKALLGALCSVIAARLREGSQASLPKLAPQLIEVTLVPYLGMAEARSLSRRSG